MLRECCWPLHWDFIWTVALKNKSLVQEVCSNRKVQLKSNVHPPIYFTNTTLFLLLSFFLIISEGFYGVSVWNKIREWTYKCAWAVKFRVRYFTVCINIYLFCSEELQHQQLYYYCNTIVLYYICIVLLFGDYWWLLANKCIIGTWVLYFHFIALPVQDININTRHECSFY